MKELVFRFIGDIKKNYKTLILAFLISFGFWLVVSVNVFPTIENDIKGIAIEAPITDLMAKNNLQITSDITEAANIKIEGKRYDISDLKATDFYASIDLSDVRSPGQYTVPITVSSKTNRELSITEVQPGMITLTIDRIISKEFRVRATAPDVVVPEGYYMDMDNVTASPETITLTGSASVINSIGFVEVRSTYHGELRQSRQTGSEIYVYGSFEIPMSKEGIQFSTDNPAVNIPIYRQKELPLTFTVINYPSNFDIDSLKFDIQPKSLTVAAPDNSINNLSELNVGTIDIADIKLNKTSFIPIVLPDGYMNLSGNNNAQIEWEIEDYSKLDFKMSRNNINIINSPDNYNVSLVTNELTLTVIGPSGSISNLSSKDFYATVNLLGTTLRTGTQDVSVSVQIMGEDQTCWVTGQYRVTINASPIEN
ncbi:MAG: hypothetical protein K2N56_07685 [Oscillospiraceae bacterium]|nr:hypothetical protein [Oscillospiraceae bacterium]